MNSERATWSEHWIKHYKAGRTKRALRVERILLGREEGMGGGCQDVEKENKQGHPSCEAIMTMKAQDFPQGKVLA